MRRALNCTTAGVFLLSFAALLTGGAARAQPVEVEALMGTWRVDLRPTPDAEPYFQQFEVRSVTDGALAGTFYGSELSEGRVNVDWGAVHFAFVTEDGSGAYNTSGVLRDGRMAGRTHALGRDFLAVWSAERIDAATSQAAVAPVFDLSAPPQTAQFAFLLGQHHCSGQQMQRDGTYKPSGEAEWNGRVILGGWAIEDEWIAPLPDGTVSRGINIRSFNPETDKWDNRWLPTGTLRWAYFEAEQVGETMVMIGGEGVDALGSYTDRNVFSQTGPHGFKWRKDRSWDGGETWVDGVAKIDCVTVQPQD